MTLTFYAGKELYEKQKVVDNVFCESISSEFAVIFSHPRHSGCRIRSKCFCQIQCSGTNPGCGFWATKFWVGDVTRVVNIPESIVVSRSKERCVYSYLFIYFNNTAIRNTVRELLHTIFWIIKKKCFAAQWLVWPMLKSNAKSEAPYINQIRCSPRCLVQVLYIYI